MKIWNEGAACFFIFLSVLGLQATCNRVQKENEIFRWTEGTKLPGSDGLAGAFIGVSNDVLIIAGGTNFKDGVRPWDDGVKLWHDEIYALDDPDGKWKLVGKLGKKMGYGLSVNYKDGIVCIGGGDARMNFSDAFILRYENERIAFDSLPGLPVGLINSCGIVVKDVLYVMGGMKDVNSLQAENKMWMLDLSRSSKDGKWEDLGNIPGGPRMLSVARTNHRDIFLFGGARLVETKNGRRREFLKDCWRFSPRAGWKQIADMPGPIASAPTPAFNANEKMFVFGGSDGAKSALSNEIKDNHPGFSPDILQYDWVSDKWTIESRIPIEINDDARLNPHGSIYATVNTPLVIWRDKVVLAGGESRPGVRSRRLLIARYLN